MGQRSGSGLGLTVVWNTVHDHNGAIDVSSDTDGTTFTLFLPAVHEEIADRAPTIPIAAIKGNNESILVVDDEESQRFIICELLELLGYQATAVSSGENAIACLRKKPVDLILMDMNLGDGLSGLQAYKKIIKMYPAQKAIIISGLVTTSDIQQTLVHSKL